MSEEPDLAASLGPRRFRRLRERDTRREYNFFDGRGYEQPTLLTRRSSNLCTFEAQAEAIFRCTWTGGWGLLLRRARMGPRNCGLVTSCAERKRIQQECRDNQ